MAQNGTVGALEPRKAGTSWNKCWNRLLTIRTDHHKPFTAQEKAKFCVQKVPNGHYWLKMAQNDTKWPKMALSRLWSPERLELVGTNIGTGCSPSRLITMNPFQHKERPNSVSRRSKNGQKLPNMAPQMPFWAILV